MIEGWQKVIVENMLAADPESQQTGGYRY